MKHFIDDYVQVLQEKIRKISNFFTSLNKKDVWSFFESIGIIHKWVFNFFEISRPLVCLIEKMNWRWTVSKQLIFDILQITCFILNIMHGYDSSLSAHFFFDAFLYVGELIIIQFQTSNDGKSVKVFIFYDFVTFDSTERKYFIYKKKLCAFIKFVTKYDYFCKHFRNIAVIYIDHKLLICFLKIDCHEKIYKHWKDKLRRLNFEIKYISKKNLSMNCSKRFFRTKTARLIKRLKKLHLFLLKKTLHGFEKTKKNIKIFGIVYGRISDVKLLIMKRYQKRMSFKFRH